MPRRRPLRKQAVQKKQTGAARNPTHPDAQAQPLVQLPPGVTLRRTLRGHTGAVFRFAWSPDGKWLASPSQDNTIRIWDTVSGEVVHTLEEHTAPVVSMAWSPDGQMLASAAHDKTVRLWSAETGQSLLTLEGHTHSFVSSVAWSPDSQVFASAGGDHTIRLWNAKTGQNLLTLKGHTGWILSVAWSPDGRVLASAADDNTIRLWNAKTGQNLLTLKGHTGMVSSMAWSPQSGTQCLVSASDDQTIRIWNAETGQTTNILEGHTGSVKCAAFSADGLLLASKGHDDTIRLWRCDTWQPVVVIPELASNYWPLGLAFHPHEHVLAAVGSDADADDNTRDTLVHIWQLDLTTLLGHTKSAPDFGSSQMAPESVQHITAKIVLVGDSGVGKTGLGWRLAHGSFREHPSTHGQQFWILDQLRGQRDDGAQCEAVLWDLAGQPDYRLIHALFLDDADLALVLFDPTNSRDPLGGADYWLQQLPPDCPKILVAARVDRGSSILTQTELDAFCRQYHIKGGFIETSALNNLGLDDLLDRMQAQIDWDAKTATTTTETFKQIKDFVLELKEDRSDRQLLFTPDQLQQRLEASDADWQFSEAEMMTAVGRLASHGYVRMLQTSAGRQQILLAPELLNNLAASFILEARRNPKGLGALEEQRVLDGAYYFPELDGLSDSDRNLMLDATIVAFLDNRLSYRCFREILGQTRLLVFPELMNLRKPQAADEQTEDDVSYTVSGASENTYASLVVLLGYTNTFLRTDQWHNQARYEFQDGLVCGFRQADDRDGELDFVLFYGSNVGQPGQALFQGLFESFLVRKNVTVHRFEPVQCAECGERLDRSVMRERLQAGKDFAFCNECGTRLQLPLADEPVRLTQGVTRQVERQGGFAEQRTLFEQAVFQLHNFVKDVEEIEKPTCFISYAWGDSEHERWVEQLAEDLEKGGLDVVFDRKDNARFGMSIPRFIDQIAASDRILVVGTPLYLKKYKNKVSETGSVVAAEMDLIADLTLGSEAHKQRVIPLLLAGNERGSFPPSLRRRVYADFRETDAYFITAFELMLSLYQLPFDHEAVVDWRRKLRPDSSPQRVEHETREFSDEQLRGALSQVGETARDIAFQAGQPVVMLNNGQLISVGPDGTERIVESTDEDADGSQNP